ncbi:MAG: hypothetical protein NVSMB21_02510 [Vulcanimicrobiaceae bacterium]
MKGSRTPAPSHPSGQYRLVRVTDESYHAFVPTGLVASVPIELRAADALLNDEARAALAKLDGLSQFIDS